MRKSKSIIDYSLYLLVIVNVIALFYFGYRKLAGREEEIINGNNNAEINSFVARINLNGADKVDTKKLTCEVGEDNLCQVYLPTAYRDNGKVMGYSTNPNSTSPEYLMNTNINLNKNIDLYVISYEINTLYIKNDEVDYISNSDLSCVMYNEDESCNVKIPTFNKVGYENKGYSTSEESLTGFVYPSDYYKLTKSSILYPIYATSARHKTINVSKTLIVNNSFIEIEESCTNDLYPQYINYLEEIGNLSPYLLFGNKISLIGDEAFNEIWGNMYVGMNYGPRKLRAIDIRCSNAVYNDYYATMVHELGHSWDYFYSTRFGNNITSNSDIINLFNKYSKLSNRPFRNYSYSNIYEFFADAVKYYYFKYLNPTSEYVLLDYPNDIKKTLEKYICIANNDYDESKCEL